MMKQKNRFRELIFNNNGYINPSVTTYLIQVFLLVLTFGMMGYQVLKKYLLRINDFFGLNNIVVSTSMLIIVVLLPSQVLIMNDEFRSILIWSIFIQALLCLVSFTFVRKFNFNTSLLMFSFSLSLLVDGLFNSSEFVIYRSFADLITKTEFNVFGVVRFAALMSLCFLIFKRISEYKVFKYFSSLCFSVVITCIVFQLAYVSFARDVKIVKEERRNDDVIIHLVLDGYSGYLDELFLKENVFKKDFINYENVYSKFTYTDLSIHSFLSDEVINYDNLSEWISRANQNNVFLTAKKNGHNLKYYGYHPETLNLPSVVEYVPLWEIEERFSVAKIFATTIFANYFPSVVSVFRKYKSNFLSPEDEVFETRRSFEIFKSVISKINSGDIKKGDYVYLHVFLPHQPYIFDKSCNRKETNLLEQSKCSVKLVKELIHALKNSSLYKFSKILIHSDHGDGTVLTEGKTIVNKQLKSILLTKGLNNSGKDSQHFHMLNIIPSLLFDTFKYRSSDNNVIRYFRNDDLSYKSGENNYKKYKFKVLNQDIVLENY